MHHRLEPRRYHRKRRVEFNPSRLLVLREPQLRIDRQMPLGIAASRDVVARNFSLVVRTGVHEVHTPIEREVFQSGLLAHLAQRRIQGLLSRLYQAFWEIPVPISAQQQILHVRSGHMHHHPPCGESAGMRAAVGNTQTWLLKPPPTEASE